MVCGVCGTECPGTEICRTCEFKAWVRAGVEAAKREGKPVFRSNMLTSDLPKKAPLGAWWSLDMGDAALVEQGPPLRRYECSQCSAEVFIPQGPENPPAVKCHACVAKGDE